MSQAGLFFIGAACLTFVGCAASPGGGHVVGNPILSQSASGRAAKEAGSCGCGHREKQKKHSCADHSSCGCAKGGAAGEASCREGACSCAHE
jgi:hypothetical protein